VARGRLIYVGLKPRMNSRNPLLSISAHSDCLHFIPFIIVQNYMVLR
jgi:hypothetical protein